MPFFLDAFISRATAAPDAVQFILIAGADEVRLTNRIILDGSSRYADLYRSRARAPRSVVLISLLPGEDLIFAFVGALMAGLVPALMPFPSQKQDPAQFWASHNALFKHIGGGLMVTFDDNVDQLSRGIGAGLLEILTPADTMAASSGAVWADWTGDEVCCLQHSSGTTGLKKGVTLTSNAIVAQIASYQKALSIETSDTIVSWLPLYHDMGFVATLLLPLVVGNVAVIMSPFEWLTQPLRLFELIERYDGRFSWLPNFAFNHLATSAGRHAPIDLSGMKAFINCSEPCKAATFDKFLEAFGGEWGVRAEQLQVCYAMAETVFAVSQTALSRPVTRLDVSADQLRLNIIADPVDEADRTTILSTGRPVEGIEVRIDGGEVGEIMLAGAFVFDGYYRKDSAQAFRNGYYCTGDLGFVRDGEVFVLGREKDLLIVLGKNFYAHEVEQIVTDVDGVKNGRVAALGIYNDEIGSEDAIVIAERDGSVADSDMRKAIKTRLSDLIGLVPKRIMFVDQGWLVKSTSGKTSRSENKKKCLELMEVSLGTQ